MCIKAVLMQKYVGYYLAHGISNRVHHATDHANLTSSFIQGQQEVINSFPHQLCSFCYGIMGMSRLKTNELNEFATRLTFSMKKT